MHRLTLYYNTITSCNGVGKIQINLGLGITLNHDMTVQQESLTKNETSPHIILLHHTLLQFL